MGYKNPKVGRNTWKNTETTKAKLSKWSNSKDNKHQLAKARKKALGDSKEMSRRSYCRSIFTK